MNFCGNRIVSQAEMGYSRLLFFMWIMIYMYLAFVDKSSCATWEFHNEDQHQERGILKINTVLLYSFFQKLSLEYYIEDIPYIRWKIKTFFIQWTLNLDGKRKKDISPSLQA